MSYLLNERANAGGSAKIVGNLRAPIDCHCGCRLPHWDFRQNGDWLVTDEKCADLKGQQVGSEDGLENSGEGGR